MAEDFPLAVDVVKGTVVVFPELDPLDVLPLDEVLPLPPLDDVEEPLEEPLDFPVLLEPPPLLFPPPPPPLRRSKRRDSRRLVMSGMNIAQGRVVKIRSLESRWAKNVVQGVY